VKVKTTKTSALKARWAVMVSRANRFLHSDTFETITAATRDGLDIMYKLAAIKSPLAIIPIAANIVGVVKKLTPHNISYISSVLNSFNLRNSVSKNQISFDLFAPQVRRIAEKKCKPLFANSSIVIYKHNTLPVILYHSPIPQNAKATDVVSIIVSGVLPMDFDESTWDVKDYQKQVKEDQEILTEFHHELLMGQFIPAPPFVKIPEEIGYVMDEDRMLPLVREAYKTRTILNESVSFTFYGPPGTGKTSCALNMAQLTSSPLIIYDETVASRRNFIDVVSLCKHPIVLFDEVEPDSGDVISILTSLAHKKDITYIFTTNTPEHLGARLGRPGRCGKMIHFPAPSEDEFLSILADGGVSISDSQYFLEHLFEFELTHDWIQKVCQQVKLGFSIEDVVDSITRQKVTISEGPTLAEFAQARMANRRYGSRASEGAEPASSDRKIL
jgi:hypothetical protein